MPVWISPAVPSAKVVHVWATSATGASPQNICWPRPCARIGHQHTCQPARRPGVLALAANVARHALTRNRKWSEQDILLSLSLSFFFRHQGSLHKVKALASPALAFYTAWPLYWWISADKFSTCVDMPHIMLTEKGQEKTQLQKTHLKHKRLFFSTFIYVLYNWQLMSTSFWLF